MTVSKVAQLRAELKALGLDDQGVRKVLVERRGTWEMWVNIERCRKI